ncbi:MAG: hypothetical protein Ct9H300mP8_05770 [Gammaproteobacteria bacterium]|nr:MAG: hypothetical protein Ct9H300mP8_05770 [Gammaproteobacteria bacterium]
MGIYRIKHPTQIIHFDGVWSNTRGLLKCTLEHGVALERFRYLWLGSRKLDLLLVFLLCGCEAQGKIDGRVW